MQDENENINQKSLIAEAVVVEDSVAEKKSSLSPEDRRMFSAAFIIGFLAFLGMIFGATAIGGVVWYSTKTISGKLDAVLTSQTKLGVVPTGQQAPAVPQQVDIKLPDTAPILGNKDAKVTIIEYADFQCPFCKKLYDTVFKQLKTEYIDTGKVKFSYQDYAFLGEESNFSAEAAKCAQDQGKFWEFHNYLYDNQGGENEGAFSLANMKKFGIAVGLNTKDFNTCVDSRIHKVDVESETQGANQYGVQATPTVFVNGKRFEGAQSYATFKQAIEEALK